MDDGEKFFKVMEEGKLEAGAGTVVFAGVKKLALFYIDGEYLCIQNHCPHAGGHLGRGEVLADKCAVMCPRHAWSFDLKTGACRTNPRYEARTYPVKVEDGHVWVKIPDDGSII
jgi:NAD(P)H-dependent nitrite reductase small subunit